MMSVMSRLFKKWKGVHFDPQQPEAPDSRDGLNMTVNKLAKPMTMSTLKYFLDVQLASQQTLVSVEEACLSEIKAIPDAAAMILHHLFWHYKTEFTWGHYFP